MSFDIAIVVLLVGVMLMQLLFWWAGWTHIKGHENRRRHGRKFGLKEDS